MGSLMAMNSLKSDTIQVTNADGALVRGFIFACTKETEAECFKRLLFGTEKQYGPIVIRIRKGDLLFLNNLDTNTLYAVFKAESKGESTSNRMHGRANTPIR